MKGLPSSICVNSFARFSILFPVCYKHCYVRISNFWPTLYIHQELQGTCFKIFIQFLRNFFGCWTLLGHSLYMLQLTNSSQICFFIGLMYPCRMHPELCVAVDTLSHQSAQLYPTNIEPIETGTYYAGSENSPVCFHSKSSNLKSQIWLTSDQLFQRL